MELFDAAPTQTYVSPFLSEIQRHSREWPILGIKSKNGVQYYNKNYSSLKSRGFVSHMGSWRAVP